MTRAIRWILGAGLLVSLLGLVSEPWWLELFGHARVSYLLLGLCLLPLVRERAAAVLWMSCLVINLACVLPLYFGGSPGLARGKLLLCNALAQNPTPELVRDFLLSEQADVVVLLEVRPSLLETLAPVLAQYPGQKLLPRSDNFGMALLSKRELTGVQVLESGGPPTIVADTLVGGHKLHVVAAHPMPPVGGAHARLRNQTVAGLGEHLRGCPRPFALLGDLNNTPWSPSLAPIRDQAMTARAGFGVLATWPSALPNFLRIAIDQCFVSPDVKVVDCRVGPLVGSDHLPLIVGVTL
ncbi:MAG: endonuclease/exonuclease/phosphatase family protein [Candidatus Eremiobacteraeota bacterium]|nr:endonuclease/exonuclease/phosphatase family protein [Candidatus Eremiobacteraeota bacterium]MCW5868731.1 endonuclease/exonuclease/phosphatase family protein [Candidatus Eremiobacteraeota bacterium]